MKFTYSIILFIGLLVSNLNAQTNKDDVLLTVGGENVYVSDFLRVYNKNLDLIKDESKNNVDEYLDLFTNFKLKLKEAEALKLDENPEYIKEFNSYKKQLAQAYLTDPKVTEELIKEAYANVTHEVKASHILVRVSEEDSPQDTLTAYNQIVKLRDQALAEGFEKVRKEVHNGQTIYGEDLGYFSGFKMVYEFEKAAFNTPVGQISKPFRTRFGYHVVYVQEKSKSQGERTVAHIMLVEQKSDTINGKPEQFIQNLFNKLKAGASFEDLAKQYSNDQTTAEKGGVLSPISRGQISVKEFEDMAFSLVNIGDISKPFQTKYGWHIVKLLDKKPVQSFENMRSDLEKKIKQDSRSKLVDEAFMTKLKSQYKIENDQLDIDYFVSILSEDYFKSEWKIPSEFNGSKPFLKIDQKVYDYQDFADYLIKTQQKLKSNLSFKDLISSKYDSYLNSKLIQYKEDRLEHENKEYANVLKEYKEGLLLFDIMSSTIWNTSENDSLAIKEFYDANKGKYLNSKKIDAAIATSSKKKSLNKVLKLYNSGKNLDEIKNLISKKDSQNIVFISDTLSIHDKSIPKSLEIKNGISPIHKHNGTFVLVNIKEVFPESQKSFEEAKGEIVSDYQVDKEKKWLEDLASKYKVVLNDTVYKTMKTQIKNN